MPTVQAALLKTFSKPGRAPARERARVRGLLFGRRFDSVALARRPQMIGIVVSRG